MKNPKAIPHLIQKLLEADSHPLSEPRSDCDVCGGANTVELIEDHPYQDKSLGLDFEVATHVCQVCGDEAYSLESHQIIQQKVEIANGNNHVKVDIHDGQIVRYSIH